jgi:tRNA threonylcarbamoyladenosine biosynthesis protein TsaE
MTAAVPDVLVTQSEQETMAAGRALGERVAGGTTVLLSGDLGAGKTAFVRGLAVALGVDPAEVSSPTFTLVHEHRGRLTLYHVDLYRLSPTEAGELGLEEMSRASSLIAVEWAERLPHPVAGAVQVQIEIEADDVRRITIRGA